MYAEAAMSGGMEAALEEQVSLKQQAAPWDLRFR